MLVTIFTILTLRGGGGEGCSQYDGSGLAHFCKASTASSKGSARQEPYIFCPLVSSHALLLAPLLLAHSQQLPQVHVPTPLLGIFVNGLPTSARGGSRYRRRPAPRLDDPPPVRLSRALPSLGEGRRLLPGQGGHVHLGVRVDPVRVAAASAAAAAVREDFLKCRDKEKYLHHRTHMPISLSVTSSHYYFNTNDFSEKVRVFSLLIAISSSDVSCSILSHGLLNITVLCMCVCMCVCCDTQLVWNLDHKERLLWGEILLACWLSQECESI